MIYLRSEYNFLSRDRLSGRDDVTVCSEMSGLMSDLKFTLPDVTSSRCYVGQVEFQTGHLTKLLF